MIEISCVHNVSAYEQWVGIEYNICLVVSNLSGTVWHEQVPLQCLFRRLSLRIMLSTFGRMNEDKWAQDGKKVTRWQVYGQGL